MVVPTTGVESQELWVGEGGLLHHISCIGMCCIKGYGFCAFFYLETGIDFSHFGL